MVLTVAVVAPRTDRTGMDNGFNALFPSHVGFGSLTSANRGRNCTVNGVVVSVTPTYYEMKSTDKSTHTIRLYTRHPIQTLIKKFT